MIAPPVYGELIDFLAAGTTPATLVAFHPSPEAKERVADPIHRQKAEGLTEAETAELEYFLQLEHVMRLARARARKRLAAQE